MRLIVFLGNVCYYLQVMNTKKYELIVIFDPKLDPEKTTELEKLIKQLLGKSEVETGKINIWGKKDLAYPIKKQTKGIYIDMQMEGDGIRLGEIAKQAKMMPEILRYLVTRI